MPSTKQTKSRNKQRLYLFGCEYTCVQDAINKLDVDQETLLKLLELGHEPEVAFRLAKRGRNQVPPRANEILDSFSFSSRLRQNNGDIKPSTYSELRKRYDDLANQDIKALKADDIKRRIKTKVKEGMPSDATIKSFGQLAKEWPENLEQLYYLQVFSKQSSSPSPRLLYIGGTHLAPLKEMAIAVTLKMVADDLGEVGFYTLKDLGNIRSAIHRNNFDTLKLYDDPHQMLWDAKLNKLTAIQLPSSPLSQHDQDVLGEILRGRANSNVSTILYGTLQYMEFMNKLDKYAQESAAEATPYHVWFDWAG